MRYWLLTLVAVVCLLGVVTAPAADWRWQLADKRYQKLDVFQRAQYDKAAELFKQKNYRAAASEFEKFKVQFEDSPVVSYMLFMHAYSRHLAKDRNVAISLYNDVLDYFGDSIDDASAALFYLGMAHVDNGDIRKGMEAMKEMADDEDYQKHPLAAGAIRMLADNHWKNKKVDEAISYWKQVVRDFSEISATEATRARRSVLAHYIKTGNYAGIDDWLVDPERREDPEHRRWIASEVWYVAWYGFAGDWEKYSEFNAKEKAADMAAFYDYFAGQRDWYLKHGTEWEFYYRAIQFAAQRTGDRKQLDPLLDEVIAFLGKMEDKKARDSRLSWVIDRLREGRQFDRARYCIAKVSDPGLAAYKEYEVTGHGEGRWREAALKLIEITKMGSAEWQTRAEDQLAWVYKDRTREYQKAIDVYTRINRPPGTLWGIQECHKRMGKLKEALQTLAELENMFPPEAARAAWYKASYLKEAGQREQAIAAARRILKVYKEAPEASRAHQMLEVYGVETGGGVVDEE